ncbi:hemolysin family protein [Halosimplex pelagicum]|uniref:HlyC/CorC family transporter n=1 Tax=Halosimplex pelagicum TaxID=869886 RepID=A0A7D5TWA9_9EURY|nr:hemolysin family protein [Halosimplex pelagicum]QLH83894.1 HlyC/CorC family transporter [Halosimplex pelagicum]
MVDLLFSTGRILAALFLVALNGFFVASEFAYVRVRSSAVDQMVAEGRAGAELLRNALDNLDDYLAVTQLGITLASLSLGWIGEPAIAALIDPVLGTAFPNAPVHLIAVGIGFSIITFLHVVFGELAPKTIAIARAEQIALFVSPPMKFFYYIFVPGLVVLNGTANYFTRLIGIPPASETEETLSEEEILTVLTRSGTKGHVDASEVEMIERVFELDDISVREVMVPRPDVTTVPADATLADLRETVLDAGHTRYPVLDAEDPDQVVGFVDVKDVLRAEESMTDDVTAADLAREMPLIPETGAVDDLLAEFQTEQRQMAAVIDEWGSFEGLATVEDVVEQVVGDLRDDFDVADREPTVDERPDGTFAIDGGVVLTEVEEALDTEFETDDVGTVGGLVLDRLGRAPEVGDEATVDGYRFTVEAVDGARIDEVTARAVESGEETDETDGDSDAEAHGSATSEDAGE